MKRNLFVRLTSEILLLILLFNSAGSVFAQTKEELFRLAKQYGQADGYRDGSREGDERARPDGNRFGERDGDKNGYLECYKRMESQAYERGFAQGGARGTTSGEAAGRAEGRDNGLYQGQKAGESDGSKTAEQESAASRANGINAGLAQGEAEAESIKSDAAAKGKAAGDNQAAEEAKPFFEQARAEYRQARMNETPEFQDVYAMPMPRMPITPRKRRTVSPSPKPAAFSNSTVIYIAAFDVTPPNPDYRYRNLSRQFSSEEERTIYAREYNESYLQGHNELYRRSYRTAYERGYDYARRTGCSRAENQNWEYTDEERKGYGDGEKRGYDDGRRTTYQAAYEANYRSAYKIAFDKAVESNRLDAAQIYNQAKTTAYDIRRKEIYRGAFFDAEFAEFESKLQIYTAEQTELGRAAEMREFAQNPLHLQTATTAELPKFAKADSKVFSTAVTLRNFADTPLLAANIRLTATTDNADVQISAPPAVRPTRNLRKQSTAEISNLHLIKINNIKPESIVKVKIKLMYKTALIAEQEITLITPPTQP